MDVEGPRGRDNLSDLASPGAELFLAGGGAETGTKHSGLRGLVESTPLYSAGVRAGLYGEPPKTYPYTSPYEAATPLLGGMAPRQADTKYLAEAAKREELANLSSPDRAVARVQDEENEVLAAVRRHYPKTASKAASWIHTRYARRAVVDRVRAEALHEHGNDSEGYNRSAFEGEIDVLIGWGAIKPNAAAKAKVWAKSASLDDVKDGRRYLVDEYFEGAYLAPIRETKRYLGIKP